MKKYKIHFLMEMAIDANELLTQKDIAKQIQDNIMVKKVYDNFNITNLIGEFNIYPEEETKENESLEHIKDIPEV